MVFSQHAKQLIRKANKNMNTSGLTPTNLNATTGQRIQVAENTETSSINKFMNHVKSDLQVQKQQKRTDQELHQKRVQNLRKELDYLKATEWKYQPVDRNVDQTYRY